MMEIVCKKTVGKKNVDSRFVLAVKTKKRKHRLDKKLAPSFKTLRSDSTFLTTNRLTNRIGLFNKGKVSQHVKRSPDTSPQTKARVKQDLQKVLELVSQTDKKSNEIDNSPLVDTPEIRPCEDIVPQSFGRVSLPRKSPLVTQDRRQSYIHSSASSFDEVIDFEELLNLYLDSISSKLKHESQKNDLYYWNSSDYLKLKEILCSKSSENTLPYLRAIPSSTHDTPEQSHVLENVETITSDEFVLNVCSEFRKKVPPKPLECFENEENCSDVPHAYSKLHCLETVCDPEQSSFQRPCDNDLEWIPDIRNLYTFEHEKSDYLKELTPDIPSSINDTALCNLKSMNNENLSSPMKPPSDDVSTPKVFFRRKMF